jgi:two-component system, OmpR family, sensor kinase
MSSTTPVKQSPKPAPESAENGSGQSVAAPAFAPSLEEVKPRSRLVAAWGVRSRILTAYVILFALSATIGLFAFRQSLHIQLEDRVNDALRQETFEFDRLVTDGRDPETGQPFASLSALFDVYFARNVPSRDEAFIGFVEGEIYATSTLGRFPLDRLPEEALANWETLSGTRPDEAESATGRVDTALGEEFFRAERVRLGDEVGAFIVTILPASDRDEIAELLTYGIIVTLGILLVASAGAWVIGGRVLAPVRLLSETAQSISRSDLTRRIEVRGAGDAAEMAQSFNAMLDRLESVFRSHREFIQDASHELRDPLTVCRGHIELLGDDPEERRETVAVVMDELDRMGRIVDELQLLAEAEQPDFLRVEWINLGAFGRELFAKAKALGDRNWVLEATGDGVFLADAQRVTEAVMNLAHNAVQHTEPADTIKIGIARTDEEVRIWVRDTGVGISVSDQERIFNRFRRGTDAHRRYRGGGLGLAIVKVILESHGGWVELESRLGEGATFTLVFPRGAGEGRLVVADPDR